MNKMLKRILVDVVFSEIGVVLAFSTAAVYSLLMGPSASLLDNVLALHHSVLMEILLFPAAIVLARVASGSYRGPVERGTRRFLAGLARDVIIARLATLALLYLFVRRIPEARTALVLATLMVVGTLWLAWVLEDRLARVGGVSVQAANEKVTLLVGGAGYIGAELAERLLNDGYHVRILDNLTYGDQAIRPLLQSPRLTVINADMRHLESLVQACRGVDSVVHLGAIVGDPACALDDQATMEINLLATRMVRDVCDGMGVRRLLFASTCSVYGAGSGISDEDSALHPVSLYACTKIDSERCLLDSRRQGCSTVIFRLATVFGLAARPRFDLVVNLLAARAYFEGKFTIFNPTQWRPFVHVADVARAFQIGLSASEDIVGGQIFNLGDDGMNFTLGQLGELILQHMPSARQELVEKSEDHRDYRVNFSRIRRKLNFQCTRDLSSGINEFLAAFESRRIVNYKDPFYYNVESLRNTPLGALPRDDDHEQYSRAFLARASAAGR